LLGDRRVVIDSGSLVIEGEMQAANHYIIGHSRQRWSDWLGYLFFLVTILGVAVHATLRYVTSARRSRHRAPVVRVYMYGMYERFWHWTMAISVILLALSGLKLHYPTALGALSFQTAVFIHNAMAVVLIGNAFLSLFFHLATGEIRQFVPQPRGLVRRLLAQAWYYGKGIFVGAAHPIPKLPEKKLNPLQQITYFGLLNVLFPLQIATGLLLWVLGKDPNSLSAIGGLTIVAPLHNLGSWLFISFMVMHVYLTTTGHTLSSNLKAMVDGWDEIDADTIEGAVAGKE
jgi:thiosulfate reductase cytochrome b subunit